jgi:hypothetical protein
LCLRILILGVNILFAAVNGSTKAHFCGISYFFKRLHVDTISLSISACTRGSVTYCSFGMDASNFNSDRIVAHSGTNNATL